MTTHSSQLPPIALVNARLVDPASGRDERGGVLVRDGKIVAAGIDVTASALPTGTTLMDCAGDVVSPGLIDLRVFVGEPGAEHRETIASATAAAAAGGITTIVATPNSTPVVDDPAVVDFLLRRARDHGIVRVLPTAAITKGLLGKEISEMGLLQEAGAIAFSDANHSIRNSQVMKRALTYARDFDALIMHFAQDADLAGSGVMNEGEAASRRGLSGLSREAEVVALDRDLRLVAATRSRYHAPLVSNALSLEALDRAKEAGLPVTCGTSINHLTLNENDVGDYRTFLKLRPPLRGEDERMMMVAALASGLIDVIVSDHDPQDVEVKRLPFAEAEFGATGLETMLAAGLRLVHSGDVSLLRLLGAMTNGPADLLRLPQGRLSVGAPADLIRFDPDEPWIADPSTMRSRCHNTPFDGARMSGRVKLTMVAGVVVFQ